MLNALKITHYGTNNNNNNKYNSMRFEYSHIENCDSFDVKNC